MYVRMYFLDAVSITCPRWTRACQMLYLRLNTLGAVTNTKLILLTSNSQERRRATYFSEWSVEHWGNGKIRFFVLANVILRDDHFSIPKRSSKRPFTAALAMVMWEPSKCRIMAVNKLGVIKLGVFSAGRLFLEASLRLFCAIYNPIAACKIKRCYMYLQSGRSWETTVFVLLKTAT